MNRPYSFDSTFFVLDFDRCIGDTDTSTKILWQVIENETGIRVEELQVARKETIASGYQFDAAEYVAKDLLRRKSNVTWADILELYIAAARLHGILEPGAGELLDILDQHQIPYGILTYGKEAWQLAKLKAAGLIDRGVPFEITLIEHKGEILASWKQGDGFVIPPALTRSFQPLHVHKIVFLDDKPRSFIGIPVGVHGICVRPTQHGLLPDQQGDLPAGVDEVQGISGAIELLFGK